MTTRVDQTTGYVSLGEDVNKTSGEKETEIGIVSEKLPELILDISNEDLVKLANKWEKIWNNSEVKTKWEKQYNDNQKYWLGEHFDTPKAEKSRPNVFNILLVCL